MSLTDRWLGGADSRERAVGIGRVLCGVASGIFLLDLGTVVMSIARGDAPHVPYALPASVFTLPVATALLTAWALGTLGMLSGWRSRLSCALVAVSSGAVVLLDAQTYSNHLYLLALMAFLFALRNVRGTDVAPLVMLQAAIVYLYAGLAKVNAEFMSGTVLAAYLPGPVREVFREMPGAGTLVLALSVTAVIVEIALGAALLVRRHRRDAFLIGFVLHVGMVAGVQPSVRWELVGFAILMFAAYVPALSLLPHARTVVWDDNCTSCATWVRWFRRLDWLGALTFRGSSDAKVLEESGITREQADASMWVLGDGDRGEAVRASGFRGVIEVLEQLPATFLWARVLRLPPVAAVGERLYRRHAARRHCAVGVGAIGERLTRGG